MRLLAISFLLATVAFASCGRSIRVSNTNSAAPAANRTALTSTIESGRQQPRLNLNTATAEELMTLPGIGEVMAKRIIDYRERHGRFRRAEEIIIIEGFSERKYRAIAEMICVE
ncbi:MAG: helix-hairpin-helix domain-containing protein [Acidobacteriota bacterium]